MRVFRGFDDLPALRRPVVTVGSYDGVHAGHRELLGRITALARQTGGESVVITFDPHPRAVLGNRGERVELLDTLEEKVLLLASLRVDNLIVAPFTPEFSRVGSLEFVRDYLVGKVGVHNLVVGYDHHFGRNHEGDFDFLSRLQSQFGFGIVQVSEQDVDRHKVSSTAIRRLVRRGDMAGAGRLLGFPYFMIVRRGAESVRDDVKLLPAEGSYPVKFYEAGRLPALETCLGDGRADILPGRKVAFSSAPPDAGEFIAVFC